MAPDPLTTLDAVMAGLHTLAELAEGTGDEALRARLTGAITGLRAAVLTVRGQIQQQEEHYENLLGEMRRQAEPAARREKTPRVKYGCYQFDGVEGLFCPACYDRQSRKIRTIPRAGVDQVCPNCRAVYPHR